MGNMKYFKIIFMLLLSIILASCCGNTEKDSGPPDQKAALLICQPMTAEYFDGVLNSTGEFTKIYIVYSNIQGGSPEKFPSGLMMINSRSGRYIPSERKSVFENQKLSEITSFIAFYQLLTPPSTVDRYKCELPNETIISILKMIQEKGEYYFNGEEYKGRSSIEIESDNDFGHDNYFSLHIYLPNQTNDRKFLSQTICKGWPPGTEPPEELKPLIDYLENTIIPAIKLYKMD